MAVRYATIKPFPIRDQLSFHKCQSYATERIEPKLSHSPGRAPPLDFHRSRLFPPPPRGHTRTTRHGGPGTGLPTGWSDLSSWGAPRAFACAGNQFAGFGEHLHLSLVRRRWLDGPALLLRWPSQRSAGRGRTLGPPTLPVRVHRLKTNSLTSAGPARTCREAECRSRPTIHPPRCISSLLLPCSIRTYPKHPTFSHCQ